MLRIRKYKMKKTKEFKLSTKTDLKIFVLFLLDNIRYPVDKTTVMSIVAENTNEIIIDYEEILFELVDSEHLLYDEADGENYYMISDKGRAVAYELYDSLDKEFRERSLRSAIKHISLSKNETTVRSFIEETATKRYSVTLEAEDKSGEIFKLSLTVSSRQEAEMIKKNFDSKPDGVYRGILFSATGRIEYLS